MGCCSSTQGGANSEAAKRPPLDRATQLPAGLSFHLPTTGPLSPQDFRQRLVCSAGTQEVHLPTSDFTLKFAYVSFRGYYPEALYKPSQDTACTISNFAGDPEQVFLGVFDGHGTSGTECSLFAKEQVPAAMQKDLLFKSYPEKSFHNAMVLANHELHESPVDDMQSGTTAVNILVRGTGLYVANVGDSRAVLAERQGSKNVAINLTVDQTAFRYDHLIVVITSRRDECDRVKMFGARVLTLDQVYGVKDPSIECWGTEEEDGGDPPRLWAPNGNYPGTAFTRSIGDNAAETIGVCAEPELAIRNLTPANPFFLIGSDGIFEFMPSQTVVDMVSKYDDPQEAAIAVVVEAYRLWLQYEVRTDDITIIVARVEGLKEGSALMNKQSMRLQTLPTIQSKSRHVSPMQPIASTAHNGTSSPSPTPSIFSKTPTGTQANNYSQLQEASIQVEMQQPQMLSKSPEDLQNIVTAVKGVPVFDSLNTKQWQIVLLAMEKRHCAAGEVVVQQGEEGQYFYVVFEGQFDLIVNSGGGQITLHSYSAGDHANSAFGELALATGRPHAARIVARTAGILFQLDANTFKTVVAPSKRDGKALIKTLRSIELLQALTVGQLEQLAQIMRPEAYEDGAVIVQQGEPGDCMFVVQSGEVIARHRATGDMGSGTELLMFGPNQYFAENALLGNYTYRASAVAKGRVTVLRTSCEDFNMVLGPLTDIIQADRKWQERPDKHGHQHPGSPGSKRIKSSADSTRAASFRLEDLVLQRTLFNDGMAGLVHLELKDQGICYTARVCSAAAVAKADMQQQVCSAHTIAAGLSGSVFMPACLKSFHDHRMTAEILDTDAVCMLSDLMFPQPLNESSAVHVAACVVAAFEQLHQQFIVFRGLAPSTVAVDTNGIAQLVDTRYMKRLQSLQDRTYSICGDLCYCPPEMLQGHGYTCAADYWSLGVLIYYLLDGHLPYQASEDMRTQVLEYPSHFSAAAQDLLHQLLQTDASQRLGSSVGDILKIMAHPFFQDLDVQIVDMAIVCS
ncbi:MAG: phosphatase 2C and cyclic nucleotide-binding kinase domain-containing -like [Trebouxia sp. A1-2]|nr:MAG: phosphatase 2C and cyclic nucleotide-binding kinase domain-containing -like [Trebouxia sp. A1-2]